MVKDHGLGAGTRIGFALMACHAARLATHVAVVMVVFIHSKADGSGATGHQSHGHPYGQLHLLDECLSRHKRLASSGGFRAAQPLVRAGRPLPVDGDQTQVT